MNGFIEPLPGLLDDPQIQSTELPKLSDFQIAPLRNPAPSRKNANIPSPLEPLTSNVAPPIPGARKVAAREPQLEKRKGSSNTVAVEPSLAWDTKKPNLAISELLEANDASEALQPTQLPSFVSLAVVERSPIQPSMRIDVGHAQKRQRLDHQAETASSEAYRHLPRPAQQDGKSAARALPLLPAMVTGLHEPPLSAALLPPMELESARRAESKAPKGEILEVVENVEKKSNGRPPELMLNSPEISPCEVEAPADLGLPRSHDPGSPQVHLVISTVEVDQKSRRAPRKWTQLETEQLMAGVQKYGIGKWKQILHDPAFTFTGRNTVDLKDRFRVCMPEEYKNRKRLGDKRAERFHRHSSPNSVKGIPSPNRQNVRSDGKESLAESSVPESHSGSPTSRRWKSPTESILIERRSSTSQSKKGDAHHDRKQRRKRCPWTPAEDDALLKGVAKHGFQWTAIHDDSELDLTHRRATDLRDRIRNKFPDGYRNAETAPLRSERNKAWFRAHGGGKSSHEDDLREESTAKMVGSSTTLPGSKGTSTSEQPVLSRQIITTGTELAQDQPGPTLPPLLLEDGDWNWENNTLPPLLDWEDMGI